MPKLIQPVNPPSLCKPVGYSHGCYDEDRGCAIEIEGIAVTD